MKIPQSVQDAVKTLLAPYNIDITDIIERKPERYITPRNAQAMTGLSARTIRAKALRREFKSIKLGTDNRSRILIDYEDFTRWLAIHKTA